MRRIRIRTVSITQQHLGLHPVAELDDAYPGVASNGAKAAVLIRFMPIYAENADVIAAGAITSSSNVIDSSSANMRAARCGRKAI